MNLITDFVDYGAVGDFVVRKHKTDGTKSYVMCMKTGDRWMHDFLDDAMRHAMDLFFDSMKGK